MTTPRKRFARSRNDRLWLENDQLCWLDRADGRRVVVRIAGLATETREHEVMYTVEEVVTRTRYPAMDRSLKPLTAEEVVGKVWEGRQL